MPDAHANAAFIVLACNSHYELLEALKSALVILCADSDSEEDNAKEIANIRQCLANIAKAEGWQ